MPARATSMSFPDEAMALRGDLKASLRYKSLNGQWKFSFSPTVEKSVESFHKPSFD
ncbi:MAG: hypothetical protein MI975_20685 [Cytophagales bacterium]|nr:hypothetical protein [Cytophagales bacterium]